MKNQFLAAKVFSSKNIYILWLGALAGFILVGVGLSAVALGIFYLTSPLMLANIFSSFGLGVSLGMSITVAMAGAVGSLAGLLCGSSLTFAAEQYYDYYNKESRSANTPSTPYTPHTPTAFADQHDYISKQFATTISSKSINIDNSHSYNYTNRITSKKDERENPDKNPENNIENNIEKNRSMALCTG